MLSCIDAENVGRATDFPIVFGRSTALLIDFSLYRSNRALILINLVMSDLAVPSGKGLVRKVTAFRSKRARRCSRRFVGSMGWHDSVVPDLASPSAKGSSKRMAGASGFRNAPRRERPSPSPCLWPEHGHTWRTGSDFAAIRHRSDSVQSISLFIPTSEAEYFMRLRSIDRFEA